MYSCGVSAQWTVFCMSHRIHARCLVTSKFTISYFYECKNLFSPNRALGNSIMYVYVRLKFQLDVHGFICILLSSIILLYMFRVLFAPIFRSTNCRVQPWLLEQVRAGTSGVRGGLGVQTPPPPEILTKLSRNFQFHGIYIRNNLITIQV
jgi:hypothetical protein